MAAREGHTLGSEGGALEWGGASASASLGFPFPWGSLEPTTPELPPHHSEFPADLAYLCASLSVSCSPPSPFPSPLSSALFRLPSLRASLLHGLAEWNACSPSGVDIIIGRGIGPWTRVESLLSSRF